MAGRVEGSRREGRGGGFGCRYLRYFGVESGRGDGESMRVRVRVRGMSLLLVKGCKGGGFGTCGWYAWVGRRRIKNLHAFRTYYQLSYK